MLNQSQSRRASDHRRYPLNRTNDEREILDVEIRIENLTHSLHSGERKRRLPCRFAFRICTSAHPPGVIHDSNERSPSYRINGNKCWIELLTLFVRCRGTWIFRKRANLYIFEAKYEVTFQGHTAFADAHPTADPSKDQMTVYSNDTKFYDARRSIATTPGMLQDRVRLIWMQGLQGSDRTAGGVGPAKSVIGKVTSEGPMSPDPHTIFGSQI